MWNYYKTVVINSAKAEDGHDMFFESDVVRGKELVENGAVNVWRNGQYDLEKIVGTITKTEGTKGAKQVFNLTCGALEAGSYLLTIKVEMDGKFLSDWASPEYNGFYKPLIVAFDVTEGMSAAKIAELVAEKLGLALPENNKFIKVAYTKGDTIITVTATDDYMFVKKENVVLQKIVLPACGDTCIGEYVDAEGITFAETVAAKQPFATGAWLLENQRLPNSNNFRYFGFNDEMPIAGALYNQYTFDYRSERPGLGGHSGVGQEIAAITSHTFFVMQGDAADAFEAVFADKLA